MALLDRPENAALKTKWQRLGGPKFVFDRVNFHIAAEAQLAASAPHIQCIPSPARSPDFDRVVEHAHANAKRMFAEVRARLGGGLEMADYMRVFEECARAANPTASLRKDVHGLPLLWRVVAAPQGQEVQQGNVMFRGVQGGWPPAALR